MICPLLLYEVLMTWPFALIMDVGRESELYVVYWVVEPFGRVIMAGSPIELYVYVVVLPIASDLAIVR